jgi:hypothetical protein
MGLRHEVLAHGWDDQAQKGWMRFRCLRCGYEYKMWMHSKVWQVRPPEKPGGKPIRRKQPYTKTQLEFLAKYWRVGNGGVSVSFCKGCKAIRSEKE